MFIPVLTKTAIIGSVCKNKLINIRFIGLSIYFLPNIFVAPLIPNEADTMTPKVY